MATKPRIHRPLWAGKPSPDTRPSAASRGYGALWRKARLDHLRANPLCVHCLEAGRTKPATQVDHIIALRKGGQDHPSNYQSLCHACHSRKTMREDRG